MFHHERELWVTYKHVAGFDEAGRGAWAGPVVAAAVVFEPECRIDGVDDSKKLSALKREKLYDQIISRALTFGVGIIDSDTVDRINILQATRQAMLVALKGLNLTPEYLLIDGNMTLDTSIQQRAIIDGDALSFTIAAASIIAKVTRDRLMVQLAEKFPGYGFDRHKGYGTKEHQAALSRLGCASIHRYSYEPIAKISNVASALKTLTPNL